MSEALDRFFTDKVQVMWVNDSASEYSRMTYLGRDVGGILLQHEATGNVVYYPWHRIEEIIPDME